LTKSSERKAYLVRLTITALSLWSCLRSLLDRATRVCRCIRVRSMMASTCADDTASPSSPFAITTISALALSTSGGVVLAGLLAFPLFLAAS